MRSDPIYLNACSRSLAALETRQLMASYMAAEAKDGEVRAQALHQDALLAARTHAARVLGAEEAQTGFGRTASQIWGTVAACLPKTRGRILISDYEWGYNVRCLQRFVRDTDVTLDVVPSFPDGAFDLEAWRTRIDEDVIAISLPLVTSLTGIVFPVSSIAALDRPDRTVMMLDAAQGLGRMDLSRVASGWDVVIATARKWARGPRETAIFSMSSRAQDALGVTVPEIEGPDVNAALRLGLGHALQELAQTGAHVVAERAGQLGQLLGTGLEALGYRLLRPCDAAPGTVCVAMPLAGRDGMVRRLEQGGIIAKWLTPGIEEPLAPYDASLALLRLSPHVYNTEEEICHTLQALGPADRP